MYTSAHKRTIKNTGIKAPNNESPANLPSGSNSMLTILFKSIFNITRTNHEMIITKVAGIKDSKDLATELGTCSGILIVKPDLITNRLISTKYHRNDSYK